MGEGSQIRILIVGSDEAERAKIARELSEAGFAVEQAVEHGAGGGAGPARPPAVVVIGRSEEGVGEELLRKFKTGPATCSIPVIQMAATSGSTVQGPPADVCLSESVPPGVMSAVVRALLPAGAEGTVPEKQEERVAHLARELARCRHEMETFASIVSHDLRSPLVSIGGCVQLLNEEAREKLSTDSCELLTLIQNSVNQLGLMIKGILMYARSGVGPMSVVECDLNGLVAEVLQSLKSQLTEAGGTATCGVLPAVRADEGLLRQVLTNLLENAVKFRGPRPPRIVVSCAEDAEAWTVSVADNGAGIDPQYLPKLFLPFQRAPNEEDKTEGVGIGLATSKRLIERHGGRIWIETELGQGTTVFFTLPKGGG